MKKVVLGIEPWIVASVLAMGVEIGLACQGGH